jgi:hypothetical protein
MALIHEKHYNTTLMITGKRIRGASRQGTSIGTQIHHTASFVPSLSTIADIDKDGRLRMVITILQTYLQTGK